MRFDTAGKYGISSYIGHGSQRCPAAHRQGAAPLFRLATDAPAPSAATRALHPSLLDDLEHGDFFPVGQQARAAEGGRR